MRVYVAATIERLQSWHDDQVLQAPVAAFAVTDDLRTELPDLGDEEAEYAVATAAAEASGQMLTDGMHKRGRRVVVVVEVSYSVVEPDDETPGAVNVVAPIEVQHIAAVLADPVDIPLTGGGEMDDLAWFAVQEIPELLVSKHDGDQ
ncbi:MAG TPA: hypothetical protein VH419_17530 [Nocardioidaceae bacterium]|jgi:hypothetical protein